MKIKIHKSSLFPFEKWNGCKLSKDSAINECYFVNGYWIDAETYKQAQSIFKMMTFI